MTQKPRADSRIESIYEEIRSRISLLEYPPGALLSENALADEFGVSRTPIREVLHRLQSEGLVESKRGVGTIVTTVDLKSLKEVYALRIKLHELTGELSPVARVTDDDIAQLTDILRRCRTMDDEFEPAELGRLYNEFQRVVVGTISNKPLREISDRLYHQTARVWLQILPDMDWSQEVDVFCVELADVIEALRAGDMQAMGDVRRHHLLMLLARIKRYLGGPTELDME